MKNIKLCLKFLFIFSIVYICFSIIIIKHKIVWGINYESKIIYLTFDDGPSYLVMNRILDILKEKEVKGTFFVVGSQIKDREKILKQFLMMDIA